MIVLDKAIIFASILIGEYPDLIGSEDANRMKSLLAQVKNDSIIFYIAVN